MRSRSYVFTQVCDPLSQNHFQGCLLCFNFLKLCFPLLVRKQTSEDSDFYIVYTEVKGVEFWQFSIWVLPLQPRGHVVLVVQWKPQRVPLHTMGSRDHGHGMLALEQTLDKQACSSEFLPHSIPAATLAFQRLLILLLRSVRNTSTYNTLHITNREIESKVLFSPLGVLILSASVCACPCMCVCVSAFTGVYIKNISKPESLKLILIYYKDAELFQLWTGGIIFKTYSGHYKFFQIRNSNIGR